MLFPNLVSLGSLERGSVASRRHSTVAERHVYVRNKGVSVRPVPFFGGFFFYRIWNTLHRQMGISIRESTIAEPSML